MTDFTRIQQQRELVLKALRQREAEQIAEAMWNLGSMVGITDLGNRPRLELEARNLVYGWNSLNIATAMRVPLVGIPVDKIGSRAPMLVAFVCPYRGGAVQFDIQNNEQSRSIARRDGLHYAWMPIYLEDKPTRRLSGPTFYNQTRPIANLPHESIERCVFCRWNRTFFWFKFKPSADTYYSYEWRERIFPKDLPRGVQQTDVVDSLDEVNSIYASLGLYAPSDSWMTRTRSAFQSGVVRVGGFWPKPQSYWEARGIGSYNM